MTTRRTLLRTLGIATVTGCAVGTAAARDRGDASGNRPFRRQLHTVERATKRYRDLDRALREGYRVMGPYVPGMGWHVVNPDLVREAAEHGPNLVRPPLLTYNPDLELGSVEYAVPVPDGHGDHDHHSYDLFTDEDTDRSHHGPSEEEAWHVHGRAQHVFSNHNGEYDPGTVTREQLLTPENWVELSDHSPLFPAPDWSLDAGDTLTLDGDEWGIVDRLSVHPSMATLHAWVHYENPAGVFAGRNPAFDDLYEGSDGGGHEH